MYTFTLAKSSEVEGEMRALLNMLALSDSKDSGWMERYTEMKLGGSVKWSCVWVKLTQLIDMM